MKEIIQELFPNKWLIILALIIATILSYKGYCINVSFTKSCLEEPNYYIFDLAGFTLKFMGFYALLFIGSILGRQKLKEELKDKFTDLRYEGEVIENISQRYHLKIPYDHYEAVRRYLFKFLE